MIGFFIGMTVALAAGVLSWNQWMPGTDIPIYIWFPLAIIGGIIGRELHRRIKYARFSK